MQFYTAYKALNDLYSPMDRGFYEAVEETDTAGAESLGFGVKDVGMSVPMGISAPNVQGIYSKIRSGVNKMEIGFPGAISGNRQAHTPEMYGKDQRQAIKELGMANEVEFTTHAAYQMMGMTGAIEQGSDLIKFDMNRARMAQHEVERAIDFAADVAGGGSVVVHTGEFERPLTDMYLPGTNGTLSYADDGRIMFKRRLTEDKDAKFYLIDDRTGQAMSTVEKDRLVAYPDWNKYNPENKEMWEKYGGKPYKDIKGNLVEPGDYITYLGDKIHDPFDPKHGRVPIYTDEGRFKIRYMSYDDFKKEAEDKNMWFEKRNGRPPNEYEKVSQTEAFLQATLETNEGHSRGWALQYGERTEIHLKRLKKLRDAMGFYTNLEESVPAEEQWKIMKKDPLFHTQTLYELVPPENRKPTDIIKDQIKEEEKGLEFARQASASQEQQAEDTAETKRHIVDPMKYIGRFAVRHYTEAALHAMERSAGTNKPVVITMENIFPDRFGGHPQELKWLIEKARDWFVKYLTEPEIELGLQYKGKQALEKQPDGTLKLVPMKNPWYRENISRKKAQELAETHIKATIDTGHLNMWRKFFQPKPGATPEDNEKEYVDWVKKNIEDLAKNKMIGNMHLTDNYGYWDDHLAPGQGNAPIRDILQILKKHGYKEALTVEPGADASTDISDFHGLMKTWRYFGSPIYGVNAPPTGRQQWGTVQYSYFGQNQPPYFIFGAYSPSNDWTLWSQVPME